MRVILDVNSKTFIIYMAIREYKKIPMYFEKYAQIKVKTQVKAQVNAQVVALLFDEAPTIVPAEYFDYRNVFAVKNTIKLLKYTRISNHIIKLK